MKKTRLFHSVLIIALLVGQFGFVGCQPQQPFYLTEKGQLQKQMITKATRIEYPNTDVASLPETCNSIAPFTLDNPSPDAFWDLSLEEAIQIALKNSKIVRTLNGVSFSKQGVAGVPSGVLSSPSANASVYDVAMTESDPRYGIEAALSAFDAQMTMGATWTKSKTPTYMHPLGTFGTMNDSGELSIGFNQITAPGTSFYMNHVNQYQRGDGPPSSWTSYIEGGFSHPLMQGGGIQFNRISGPGASPGFYNGVMIARINTDMALADFEVAARNLVADVEKAYWNLYYAYYSLQATKAGHDAAQRTWSQTYAKYVAGATGGRVQFVMQAQRNYFAFQAQTQVAQSNLFKAEDALRYILGQTVTDGRLIRPMDEPIIAPVRLDWQNIKCEALVRSPELRKQKWDVKAKEMQLIASKNFLLPRLDLNGGFRLSGAGKDLLDPNYDKSSAYGSMTSGDYPTWVLGLNMSMPLGWRKELAGVRNAQLAITRSRTLLREQELELDHQLADAIREISLTYNACHVHLQVRKAASEEVKSIEAAITAGTMTLDQLLNAQQSLAQAETDYYRSVVDYNLALMTLHYRKGSLLEYNNVCLAEGPWPQKAYFDATRRARQRDASRQINYGFTRPQVVSKGTYQQFQHDYQSGMIYDDVVPTTTNGIPTVAPSMPTTVPAPTLPSKPMTTQETVIETTMQRPVFLNTASVDSVASPLPTKQASFTTPAVTNVTPLTPKATPSRRYIETPM